MTSIEEENQMTPVTDKNNLKAPSSEAIAYSQKGCDSESSTRSISDIAKNIANLKDRLSKGKCFTP